MVTHHHLLAALVETWVDVKGNVVASQKVHGEPGKEIRGAWTDIQYMLTFSDCNLYVCLCVCVCFALEGKKERNLESQKWSLHFSIWFHVAKDGHHHLVIRTSGQVQVVWHTLNARQ